MDPLASIPGNAAPSSTAPLAGPRVLQLFPLPGSIYESARFYYDSTADLTTGDFGAVLTFATAHGHPVTVFECRDLQQFQLAHPLAVVRPLIEVPPAILERRRFLFASVQTPASQTVPSPAPPTVAPPAPADNSAGSSAHGSHASSSLLTHVSLVTSCGNPSSVPLLLGPQGALLPPIAAAPPRRPDPDGSVGPAVSMGRACTVYGGQFSCGHFSGPYHGGSHCGPLHGGSLQAVSLGHCFPSSASTDKH
jgi:hypothetical protein